MQFMICCYSLRTLSRFLVALLIFAYGGSSQAQGFKIPSDYYSRFGTIQIVADTNSGLGVRDLPLPFDTDVRVSIVKAPTYWDYGLSFRQGPGEIRFGVFYSALQFRAAFLPSEGMQFLGVVHRGGGDFAGGYAWRVLEQKVRIVAVGGMAFEGTKAEPYLQVAASGGENRTFGALSLGVDGTAVATYFPQTGQLEHAYGATVRGTYSVTPNLSVYGYHYAQFVFGSSPLAMFEQYPAQVSYLGSTYRFDASGAPVEFGALKLGAARNWRLDQNSVAADVYFRVSGLPALVGLSVSCVFNPDGTRKWVYSFASL